MRNEQCDVNENVEFEVVYRKYFDGVYKYVYRKISHAQAAEDIVQETFCAAYVKGRDFLEHSQPQLWLLCTAKYKILELYRKMQYRTTVPLEDLEQGQEEMYYGMKELELTALAMLSEREWELVKGYYLY